jgi:hypothetical protein
MHPDEATGGKYMPDSNGLAIIAWVQNNCKFAAIPETGYLSEKRGPRRPGRLPNTQYPNAWTSEQNPPQVDPFKTGDRVLVNYNKQRMPGTVVRLEDNWVIVKINDWSSKGNSFSPKNVSLMEEQLP